MPLESLNLRETAVLLDIDGTILELAPTPHEVVVPPDLLDTLRDVLRLTDGAMALVSGRPIGDIDFIFAPLRLPAVGGHGAEIRLKPHDPYEPRAAMLSPLLKQQLKEVAARFPRVGIEDKGFSLALHYRLALESGLDVVDAVFRVCKTHPPDSYELLTGKAIIEVKSVGFNKGSGVCELMAHEPFAGRTPIFVGDDTTDEHAFAVMPEFDGLAISVGRSVPGADARFRTPHDVRQWLRRMVDRNLALAALSAD